MTRALLRIAVLCVQLLLLAIAAPVLFFVFLAQGVEGGR